MKETTKTRDFSTIVKDYNANPADTLQELATAVTYAVLKKVIDPQSKSQSKDTKRVSNSGCNPALVSLRRELTRDRNDMDRLARACNNSSDWYFDKDGNVRTQVTDKELHKDSERLAALSLGDGLDLVHDAVIALLDETAKQAEREPEQPLDLERVYTVRRLKKRVYIKADESKAWESVETTPIQEVYRAVRRSIQNSRAVQVDPRNGYTYLQDLAHDDESGNSTDVYRRLPKYADLGGAVCDFNGKETIPTTADSETVESMDKLVGGLGLTDRQAQILSLRLRGYGYKAIATYFGVTQRAIAKSIAHIQTKAVAVGLTLDK